MKEHLKFRYIILCLLSMVLGILVGRLISQNIPNGLTTEDTCKEYIILHTLDITKSESSDSLVTYWYFDTCTMNYWTNIKLVILALVIYVYNLKKHKKIRKSFLLNSFI